MSAERSLLGALLIDGELLARIPSLRPDDFDSAAHAAIFAAMKACESRAEPIDPVTVGAELELAKRLDVAGGRSVLSDLMDGVPDVENVESYAKLVKRAAATRGRITLLRAKADALTGGAYLDDVEEDLRRALGAKAVNEGKPGEEPRVSLLADVLAETTDEQSWIVRGLLAVGAIGTLAGDYYLGKSTLLAILLAHAAAGRPFLGFEIPRPVPVLYWQAEGNRKMFAERVACACFHAGIDASRLDFGFPPSDFIAPFDSEDFARFVVRSGRKLVACDSVGYFMNEKADENSASDWKRYTMKPLRTIGREAGVSFVLAHHYGKPAENRLGRHRPRGSSAIGADCDLVMRLEAPNGEQAPGRTLFFDKVRDTAAPPTMALTFEKAKALMVRDETEEGAPAPSATETRAKAKASEASERDRRAKEGMALLLRQKPAGLTAEEVRGAVGRRLEWVADALGDFHARNWIKPDEAERVNAKGQKRRVPVWKWTSPGLPEPFAGSVESGKASGADA